MATPSIGPGNSGYVNTEPLNPQFILKKCMGASGDYDILRSEDIAFLFEAFSELWNKYAYFTGVQPDGRISGCDKLPWNDNSFELIGNRITFSFVNLEINRTDYTNTNSFSYGALFIDASLTDSTEHPSMLSLINSLPFAFGVSEGYNIDIRSFFPPLYGYFIPRAIKKEYIQQIYRALDIFQRCTMLAYNYTPYNGMPHSRFFETTGTETNDYDSWIVNVATGWGEYQEFGGAFVYDTSHTETPITSLSSNTAKKYISISKKQEKVRLKDFDGNRHYFTSEIGVHTFIQEIHQEQRYSIEGYISPYAIPVCGNGFVDFAVFMILESDLNFSGDGFPTVSRIRYKYKKLSTANYTISPSSSDQSGHTFLISIHGLDTRDFVNDMSDWSYSISEDDVPDPSVSGDTGEDTKNVYGSVQVRIVGFDVYVKPSYSAKVLTQ